MTITNQISKSNINLVDDEKLREYGYHDANVDNNNHPDTSAFSARLVELANAVNKIVVASTISDFRKWADDAKNKFQDMATSVPGNDHALLFQVNNLDIKTTTNLNNAKDKYANNIIQLSKDKIAWEKRFGAELFAKLGEPVNKNLLLLVGLVVFLLAVESMVNSQFFAQASELGLLGGTLTAITVSLANVLISPLFAFFGHRFFYRHDSYRYIGTVIIILFFTCALGFNYLVSRSRESTLSVDDSSIFNFVLLFALGFAVAVVSFSKMWFYLDPYKQARKSLDDLENARRNFRETTCADLVAAQEKYEDIEAEIKRQNATIPVQFQATEANYNRVHSEAVMRAKATFTNYHNQYAPPHRDPDPDCPEVTLESAGKYGVGITAAEWQFVANMKEILEEQRSVAKQEWIPLLQKILDQIVAIIKKFAAVITAVLADWSQDAQTI